MGYDEPEDDDYELTGEELLELNRTAPTPDELEPDPPPPVMELIRDIPEGFHRWTVDDFRRAAEPLQPMDRPRFLFELAPLLPADVVNAVVPEVWCCGRPMTVLTDDEWRYLWSQSGYAVSPTDRPASSPQLWRGATRPGRSRWSWSDVRETAELYATNEGGYRPEGKLWAIWAPPEALLGYIPASKEYIVDTSGLAIITAQDWDAVIGDL